MTSRSEIFGNFSWQTFQSPAELAVNKRYLAECESIRGWAILLVVLFHFSAYFTFHQPIANPNPVLAFVYAGNTGVTLFFVLSGFLLSMPWLRGRPVKLVPFYRNRLLRILPMYFVVVAIGALYCKDLLAGLETLFFYNIHPNTLFPFGVVLWSLVIEMQFYLLLPIVMLAARRDRLRYVGLAVMGILLLAYVANLSAPDTLIDAKTRLSLQNSIVGRWPNFLAGIICAWFYVRRSTPASTTTERRVANTWRGDFYLLLILALLCWQFVHVTGIGITNAETRWPIRHCIEGVLWAVFIFILVAFPLKTGWLFVNAPLHTLGILAYSIYLLHFPLLERLMSFIVSDYENWFVQPNWGIVLVGLGSFTLVIALSMLTYTFIERSFLALKSH